MQDAQYRALQGWIREVQPMLLLGDWEIWVQREPSENDAWASVDVAEQRDTVWLKVAGAAFFDISTPEDQRLYLTHELVHVITAPVLQVLQTLGGRDESESVQVFKTEHRRVVEQATHKLARLLAPALPLPAFPRTEDQDISHEHDNAYPTGGLSRADWTCVNGDDIVTVPNAAIAGRYVAPKGAS